MQVAIRTDKVTCRTEMAACRTEMVACRTDKAVAMLLAVVKTLNFRKGSLLIEAALSL